MLKTVKPRVLLTIFLFSIALVQAQSRNIQGVAADVKKVIEDYPNRFANITGDVIIQNPQSTDYRCNFKVSGAEECSITRYSSDSIVVASWQALFLTTDDFAAAKKKFRALYSDLNGLAVGSQQLKGIYENPVEEKRFATVLLAFPNSDSPLKKLIVELLMEAQGMDWKVKLLVYDRERLAVAQ
jgi:hypothetical protein